MATISEGPMAGSRGEACCTARITIVHTVTDRLLVGFGSLLATLFASPSRHLNPTSFDMSHPFVKSVLLSLLGWLAPGGLVSGQAIEPLVRVVDLDIDESAAVTLHDGVVANVRLLALDEDRDRVRQAVRSARVRLDVNGAIVELESGMYNLPVTVGGVQVDCSITSGYNSNGTPEFWGLKKQARLRLWPAGSALTRPGTFRYPVDQRWFASATWFDNEPIDGGARILPKIYYHSGLDIGGAEGMVNVSAATDALVVSVGLDVHPDHREGTPVKPRYDVVYLLDGRGWYYRYSHLQRIDESLAVGRVIPIGHPIGVLGKEGASGGWSHLHFEIVARQPSGEWGTQAGDALIREAYLREHRPRLIACSRPRHFLVAGESAELDGSRSWSATGEELRYEWRFTDGGSAVGEKVRRSYPRPGRYSEILKVTDAAGNIDYDFAIVQVLNPETPDLYSPSLHAAYAPTLGLTAGQEVTFKVRGFNVQGGEERWDFGDGSPAVTTRSDGNVVALNPDGYAITTHRYATPGDYLVRIERTGANGLTATEHLHVIVE